MILLEDSLSKKERDNLPSDMFGLQKDRKYPLHDKEHVEKAIQFFKYCPPTKRNELAKNINRKIKEYNMNVKISKDSEFYKYIDKNIITESNIVDSEKDNNYSDKDIFITVYKTNICEDSDIYKLEMKIINFIQSKIDTNYNIPILNDRVNIKIEEYLKYKSYENNYSNQLIYYIRCIDILNSIREYKIDKDMVMSIISSFPNISIYNITMASRLLYIKFEFNNRLYSENMDYYNFYFKLKEVFSFVCNTKYTSTERYLEELKCNNINSINDILPVDNNMNNIIPLDNILGKRNINRGKICKLNNVLDVDKLNNRLSNPVNFIYKDIIILFLIYNSQRIGKISDNCGDDVYYTSKDDKEYIIASDKYDEDIIVFIEISDVSYDGEEIEIGSITGERLSNKAKYNYDFNKLLKTTLTEGIEINKHGDVKFSFPKNKSYMDLYMENHKILVANIKAKNIEGAKYNLAYVFMLIHNIENTDKYKKKDKDIMKARAFLINDFKSYYKKILELDPKFDFSSYYYNSDFDKIVVADIKVDTIVGIKKLIKGILFS